MRKILITLLLILLVTITGCSANNTAQPGTSTDSNVDNSTGANGTEQSKGTGISNYKTETVFDTLVTLPEDFKANVTSYESRWAYVDNESVWLPNQTATVPVQRFIYYDKDNNVFDVYSEVILEPLSDENREALISNSPSSEDVLQYIVDINNKNSDGENGFKLTPDDFAGIVFSIEEMDDTYFLVSTRFVPVRRLADNNPADAIYSENGTYYFFDETGKTVIALHENDAPVSEIVYDSYADDWVLGGIYDIDKIF